MALPSSLPNLGSWYKADTGVWQRSAAGFTRASSQGLFRSHSTSLDMGNGQPRTVGGWVYTLDIGIDVWMAYRGGGGGPNAIEYQMYTSGTGSVSFVIWNGVSHVFAHSLTLPTNTWTFVVGGWDPANGGTIFSQINNNTPTVGAGAGTPTYGLNHDLGLGYDPSAPSNYMNGRLQNWFVFGRTLSAAEITYLYNSGNGRNFSELDATFKTELRAWWPLGETTGNNRLDLSGNGNHLSPVNAPVDVDGQVLNPATDNTRVYQWDDQGPKGLHVSQPTVANRPTWIASAVNGQPAVDFEASNGEFLGKLGVATASLPVGVNDGNAMLVYWPESIATPQVIYGWVVGASNAFQFAPHTGGTVQIYHGGSGGIVSFAVPAGYVGAWHIGESYRNDNTAMELRVDSSVASIVPSIDLDLGSAGWYLGDNGYGVPYDGKVTEIAIYTVHLSATDRTTLRNYMNARYFGDSGRSQQGHHILGAM